MVGLQPSCLEGVTPVVAQHSNAASWPRMIGIMRYRLNTTCSAAFQCCVLAPRMIGIMRYVVRTCRDNEDLDPNLRWDDGTPTHSI